VPDKQNPEGSTTNVSESTNPIADENTRDEQTTPMNEATANSERTDEDFDESEDVGDFDDFDDADEPDDRRRARSGPTTGSRMLRLLGSLFAVHAEVAKQELSTDQNRVIKGLVLLTVGLASIAMVVLLLQGVFVWLLVQRGLALGFALLAVAGGDLLVALVTILWARRCFQTPLLPKTRALVRRTIAAVWTS